MGDDPILSELPPPPTVPAPPISAAPLRFRNDRDRARSVSRKANPLWRKLIRGAIAMGLLASCAVLAFVVAREVRDRVNRDRLPAAGVDVPTIASATFLLTSASPSPALHGTITIDFGSGTFEFVGASEGPQPGLRVVRVAPGTAYSLDVGGSWQPANADPLIAALDQAIPFLRAVDGPDAVFEGRLRKGYVDLDEVVEIGRGDDLQRRYDFNLDTDGYSARWPLQWSNYNPIPALKVGTAVPAKMWLDRSNVVVRFEAPESNWSWQRLTYSEFGIEIADPT